jgi:hypothetical protein
MLPQPPLERAAQHALSACEKNLHETFRKPFPANLRE